MFGLLIGAVILAGIHAMIPNHWMPVILLGRSERWGTSATLGVTALAGFAHTLSTILIGILVGIAGISLSSQFEVYSRFIAPAILFFLGLFFVILDLTGRGGHSHSLDLPHDHDHKHEHDDHEHDHEHGHDHDHHHEHSHVVSGEADHHHHHRDHHDHHDHSHGRTSSKSRSRTWIVFSLMTAMFFSPCMEIEAYYLTAAPFGWPGIVSVSLIYLFLTVAGMMALVWFGMKGASRLNWHFLEHHEKLVTGLALMVISIGAYFIH